MWESILLFYGLFDREAVFPVAAVEVMKFFHLILLVLVHVNKEQFSSCGFLFSVSAFHCINFEKKPFLSEFLQNSNSSPYSFPWLHMILVFLAVAVAHTDFLSFQPLLVPPILLFLLFFILFLVHSPNLILLCHLDSFLGSWLMEIHHCLFYLLPLNLEDKLKSLVEKLITQPYQW